MSDHATVRAGGFVIPLIGVPKSATEDKCDKCGKPFHITELEFNGSKMLCKECRKDLNE